MEKFTASGILFKFAKDHLFDNGTYLYGGKSEDIVAAQKAAGHERKALQSIAKLAMSMTALKVTAPLMTILDFLGSRLSAQAIVPHINSETIVYGSADGGVHLKDVNELEENKRKVFSCFCCCVHSV